MIVFIILYTVKWNCCSLIKLLEYILKISIFLLKSHVIKTSDATSFLQCDRKFHMNAGWKSPHLAEPTHVAGPAHLIWTVPKLDSLFREIISPQGCNCTKKDTITGVSLRICSCEYIFSLLLFCFRKTKAVTGDVLWKKVFPKVLQISQESTCAGASF